MLFFFHADDKIFIIEDNFVCIYNSTGSAYDAFTSFLFFAPIL